jgi:hypothetical protein
MLDRINDFKSEPRMLAIAHLYGIRRIIEVPTDPNRTIQSNTSSRTATPVNQGTIYHESLMRELNNPAEEAWGMRKDVGYLMVICGDRITLVQMTSAYEIVTVITPAGANVLRKRIRLERKLLWTCPSNCIDQLCSDRCGDLIITVNTPLAITGPWHQTTQPTVLDREYSNYVILQSLLEQTIGLKLARMHPLYPSIGLLQANIRKRYSTGIRSFLFSPSYHIYRLFGCCLYEYSYRAKMKSGSNTSGNAGDNDESSGSAGNTGDNMVNNMDMVTPMAKIYFTPTTLLETSSEEYTESFISFLFPPPPVKASPYSTLPTNPVVVNTNTTPASTPKSNPSSSSLMFPSPSAQQPKHHSLQRRGSAEGSTITADPSTNKDEDEDTVMTGTNTLATASTTTSTINTIHDPTSPFPTTELISDEQLLQNTYLSFIYPLVDLTLSGPTTEENGKYYSITLARMDNAKMRCLKREDENDHFTEYLKNGLSLLFPTYQEAMQWRIAIEEHKIFQPEDCLPASALTMEERKKSRMVSSSSAGNTGNTSGGGAGGGSGSNGSVDFLSGSPLESSILTSLVLPTSGFAPDATENIKLEIAQAMLNHRK